MVDATTYRIFKTRSRTFFVSSLFFPAKLRDDVFTFYSFVRTADDLVDTVPAQREKFFAFKQQFETAYRTNAPSGNALIDDFIALMRRSELPYPWIAAFFSAMEADLSKTTYATFAELEQYMYGSAEIVGLSMCKLIGLPEESYAAAKSLGRAFQYINFIRDLAEDLALGRQYIPTEALQRFGFTELSGRVASERPHAFKELIRHELNRYRMWQTAGAAGFKFIPRRYLIPIKTAADLYLYTARAIERDPSIILKNPVKPSLPRIFATLVKNIFTV